MVNCVEKWKRNVKRLEHPRKPRRMPQLVRFKLF
jgi:hypothetical protein